MKEVGLVSSVASPQVLEALAVDCRRLRDAISRTKDMIHLKGEERDKGLLKVIHGLYLLFSFSAGLFTVFEILMFDPCV